MPDRGDERGRGGTRTLVTGILAGTEWHPATNPQEATQTARDARDLAVRLRPVLSKLAQAPRGGRRKDLEWLPAVEQLAVDAQYFASWWLPRLEGKSAQSWPSWSADGYADWVKRLDAQRLRTLEMVEGTAPVTRIASVTQLRRGKGATAEPEEAPTPAPAPENVEEPPSPARHARGGAKAAPTEEPGEERTARITPLRGPGAALMDAALMDVTQTPEAAERTLSADETHISAATPVSADAPTTAAPPAADAIPDRPDVAPPVPRTPPNQGPVEDDPNTTHISRAPADSAPLGFDALASGASEAAQPAAPQTPSGSGSRTFDKPPASEAPAGAAAPPRVPHTPPNQGPAGEHVGADILQIPRTPPNKGPAPADAESGPRAPVVSLVGDDDRPRVPRTPPNPGPPGGGLAAADDPESTHISSRTRRANAAANAGGPAKAANAANPAALAPGTGTGAGAGVDTTRPLFRPEPADQAKTKPAAAPAATVALAGAGVGVGVGAGAAVGAGAGAGAARGSRSSGLGSGGGHDEVENVQPGSDLPPPVFPMTEPTEPVDRGRIVRYALAAVLLAAGCVAAFVAATQKSSSDKNAAPPASSSSTSSTAAPSSSATSSSANGGAVTAPTATDASPVSSTASKPPAPSSKPSPPPSTPPKTSAASHTSAAQPPPPPATSTHQPPPASSGVSSLSVSSLAPDQTGSYNYIAHVHVTTRGTGSVTVTVTLAGSSSSTSPGSTGAQSQSITLSGKTSYDLAPSFDVHGMCGSPGQSPYIDAVASASGAGSSVAYASSPC